jgi:hypothetical protein
VIIPQKPTAAEIERQIKLLELQLAQREDDARTKERTSKRFVRLTKKGWKAK